MKKETKEMLVMMLKSWNQFNAAKAVVFEFEESEFSRSHWSLELKFSGVVPSDFIGFFLPALAAHNCIWFMSAVSNQVYFHIQ